MSKANAEQTLAIEHTGGVLLRAGAGSGKTFVLVEHILYLTRKWIAEHKASGGKCFEELIRSRFSEVVMMTFTKKAAGEMSIRLSDKFAAVSAEADNDRELWQLANEALPLLTVTTIDGFCRRLITNGYFPHLSTEAKVIFTAERLDRVREVLERWFKECSDKVRPEVLDIVIREKRSLLSAFGHVFNDPGLRLSWKKFSPEDVGPESLPRLLSMSFVLNGLESSLLAIDALDLPRESERSSFEALVGQFQATGLPVVDSVEKLRIYFSLFSTVKVLRGESAKKKTPGHEAAKEGLVALRDWSREWSEVITDYTEHYEDKVLPWLRLCQDLFHWIEERLDPNQGITFGDIEYFVAQGLEISECRDRIHKDYKYFIVDEFQDTSSLQFRIIQGLIGSDYGRLFCVGDAKQAIYGFRGGELSVFQDCGDLVPRTLSLANNYRSLPGIIQFNNSLFKTILPLGSGYIGNDFFSVIPEDQKVPLEVNFEEQGEVEILTARAERDLEAEGKFSTEEINRLESHVMADSIEKRRLKSPLEVCTVLYSKLKPSAELIRTLMAKDVGFTAQFKIDLLDDPVLGIFLCLLRRQFDSNKSTRVKYPTFILKSYLNVLGVPGEISEQDLTEFDLNVKFWGLIEAFRKFLFRLCLTNENSDLNFGVIETLSSIYHQDPESSMVQMLDGDNDSVSLDFRFGENANMVQIMTAHASKGLEFDTVYLGGIYTNGRDNSDSSIFGDRPGSFSWYKDLGLREKKKSPFYVFEDELNSYKSFSESKRLFYVACTRARKRLIWVDLEFPKMAFSVPKNSWIEGLSVWRGVDGGRVRVTEVEDQRVKEVLVGRSLPDLPLFFHDSMGLYSKGVDEGELAIVSELSVTRLNSLLDCPRKFYFENTLKLSAKDSVTYHSAMDEEGEVVDTARSSAGRGTLVHAQIAKGIERNFVVPREVFSSSERKPVEWALELLRSKVSDFEMVPEKQIKFRFFNFMISGIPDLILYSKGEQKTQIWDFKTGRLGNLDHYWLQLSIYAYALFDLGRVPKDQDIELVLCFVDEEKKLIQSINCEKCKTVLYPVWSSQNRPWETNLEHCSQCSYGDICLR